MRFIVVFASVFAVAMCGGKCPASHPNVYYNGDYCCASDREKVYTPHGALCDGGAIAFDSLCCEANAYIACTTTPCSDYGTSNYCLQADSYLAGYAGSKRSAFSDKQAAMDACTGILDCNGITLEGNQWTLRMGPEVKKSPSETSYTICTYRSDYRCGPSYKTPNGAPGQCDPNQPQGWSCCNPDGWCGSSWHHCECNGCIDYRSPVCSCKSISDDVFKLTAMNYDTAQSKSLEMPPTNVAIQEIDNEGSSREQTSTFSASEEVSESASFSHTAGASITVGTEFSVGLPFIASGSVSMEVSANYEFSYGTDKTVTKSISAEYQCTAPAYRTVECHALLFKYKTTVPYTQTWTHKDIANCECKSTGVLTEVSANRMTLRVNEKNHEADPSDDGQALNVRSRGGFSNVDI